MKTLFIYNPNAGKMQIKNYLYNILNIFSNANYDLTVFPTKKTKDAETYILNRIQDFDYVICSGGDGTLNEVINGMMKSKVEKLPKLGYIPAGTTNDFATSLKLPTNMEKAAELAIAGSATLCDIGKFNTTYFEYIAAFGAFSEVSYATPQDIKNTLGHLAYVLEGVKSIPNIKSYNLKIKVEDITIEGKFIYGMITNTYSVGGIYKFNRKEVELDDGKFEVTLVKEPKDIFEFSEIGRFFLGNDKNTNTVISFKTKELTIETEDDIHWTLDGEYGGNPKNISISIINKAVNIVSKIND